MQLLNRSTMCEEEGSGRRFGPLEFLSKSMNFNKERVMGSINKLYLIKDADQFVQHEQLSRRLLALPALSMLSGVYSKCRFKTWRIASFGGFTSATNSDVTQQRPSLTLGQNRDKSSSGFHCGASDGGGEECVGMLPLCLGLCRLLSGAGWGVGRDLKTLPLSPRSPGVTAGSSQMSEDRRLLAADVQSSVMSLR